MTDVRLDVLGPMRITCDGIPFTPTGRTAQVLYRLIAEAPESVSLFQIYCDIWKLGDGQKKLKPEDRNQVHKHISELRKHLGRSAIVEENSTYRLALDAERCDWLRFENLVNSQAYGQALELWRGAPFGIRRNEEYLREPTRRLEELRQKALCGSPTTSGGGGNLARRQFPRLSTVLVVQRGDLFDVKDANIAVGFGDTLDTDTDQDTVISRKSVLGQLRNRAYQGNQDRLDRELAEAVENASITAAEELAGKTRGKRARYPVGTTVALVHPDDDQRRIFGVVHCRQGADFVTRSTSSDLEEALRRLWGSVINRDVWLPLAMPALGAGGARVEGMTRTHLIITIIASYLEDCRKRGWGLPELRIIVRTADLDRIDIEEIQRYVRTLDADGREPASGG